LDKPEEKQYRMVGRVVLRRIGTDTLLVPVSGLAAGGRVFPVNPTAECVWSCLSAGGTPAEAAAQIADQFGGDPAEALADCIACAQTLCDEQLLEEVAS